MGSSNRPTRSCSSQPLNRHPGASTRPACLLVCCSQVLSWRSGHFPRETWHWERSISTSCQFPWIWMRRTFFCPFPTAHHRPHHYCLSVWVPPRKIVSRYHTQPFLRLPQKSSSLVRSLRRHSRARLPALSNQTRFQLEVLSDCYWRKSTDTEKVSKMLRQTDCPHGLRLVPGRHIHELAWLTDCFPPLPVEWLPDLAPGAVWHSCQPAHCLVRFLADAAVSQDPILQFLVLVVSMESPSSGIGANTLRAGTTAPRIWLTSGLVYQLAVPQLVLLRFPRRRTHVVRFSGGSLTAPSPVFCSTRHRATPRQLPYALVHSSTSASIHAPERCSRWWHCDDNTWSVQPFLQINLLLRHTMVVSPALFSLGWDLWRANPAACTARAEFCLNNARWAAVRISLARWKFLYGSAVNNWPSIGSSLNRLLGKRKTRTIHSLMCRKTWSIAISVPRVTTLGHYSFKLCLTFNKTLLNKGTQSMFEWLSRSFSFFHFARALWVDRHRQDARSSCQVLELIPHNFWTVIMYNDLRPSTMFHPCNF